MNVSQKPNVLLINTDHWPARLMRCAGDKNVMTPTIDTLAGDGIRFTNVFSSCPVCIPARRSLMTGLFPKTHGDRVYSGTMPMPEVPTLAESFSKAGYQTGAVGKLHVYPQRSRIGFDEVILSEEGRYQHGVVDDYQLWLGDNGYVGLEHAHGLSNNEYDTRPWHLPEEAHHTFWATQQMSRMIQRRDPTKPAFYYLSYIFPHPPLVPLEEYMKMYQDMPFINFAKGDWTQSLAPAIEQLLPPENRYSETEKQRALQAFYAQCTYIDHQLRVVLGTLREEGLLANTIIGFTSDHGDMLFNHGMIAKRCFYQNAANVPFILSGRPIADKAGTVSDTLGSLEDVMPTLLDLCGIDIPETVEGNSLFSEERPSYLYGEISVGTPATRMVTDGTYKLIYYPYGNVFQLFDYQQDPQEERDLSTLEEFQDKKEELTQILIDNLYDPIDLTWIKDGKLVGVPGAEFIEKHNFQFGNQRGGHWPPPINK